MVMGRPKKINAPQITSLVLGDEHRVAIKKHIGEETTSKYIRDCILMRTHSVEGVEQEELRQLKEELLKQAKQLKQYKRNEQKMTERHQADLERLRGNFVLYTRTPKDIPSINNWVHMRVKNMDITVGEAYSHLEATGVLVF